MRIPAPAAERFIDPALMRHALLDGAVRRIGGALDIDQLAPELVNILVPHFCNSAGHADAGEPARRRRRRGHHPGR